GQLVGVAKKSKDKASVGGRKTALRRLSSRGVAEAEVVGVDVRPRDDGDDRELMVPLVESGQRVSTATLQDARERLQASLRELPAAARRLSKGDPAIPTVYED